MGVEPNRKRTGITASRGIIVLLLACGACAIGWYVLFWYGLDEITWVNTDYNLQYTRRITGMLRWLRVSIFWPYYGEDGQQRHDVLIIGNDVYIKGKKIPEAHRGPGWAFVWDGKDYVQQIAIGREYFVSDPDDPYSAWAEPRWEEIAGDERLSKAILETLKNAMPESVILPVPPDPGSGGNPRESLGNGARTRGDKVACPLTRPAVPIHRGWGSG